MDITPPPKTDFVVDIGEAEIDFYHRNGYLVCGEMTTPEEVAWLVAVYDTLLAMPRSGFLDGVFDVMSPYGSKAPPKLGQLLLPEKRVPSLRETALWKNARRIALKLLGEPEDKVENWGHILYKAPNSDNVTPWHQDEAYWDVNLSYNALGGWTPLQDVDIANGCLWFLPGSHKSNVMRHRHYGDDPAVHVLEVTDPIDTSAAVPVPMVAGAMSFHHPRTLHYAGPNTTGSIRRAWANEFQTAPAARDVPADHPWVLEGKQAMQDRWVP